MRTEELITMLATGEGAVATRTGGSRYSTALACGASVAALMMATLLGVRPDLAAAMLLPMFWVKLGFTACLTVLAVTTAVRLSRPGLRPGWVALALAAPIAVMWALAAIALLNAGPAQRAELFFGSTWTSCPILIALLSVPLFVAVLWAMKGLAPTRLRLAGASAGLAAGTGAALIYCLHCPELAAPFIGVWYVAGMLIPAAAGALLAPRFLRW
jgi:hypothetical protein